MEGRLRKHVASNWEETILVCSKCSKKLKGGFGPRGKLPLAKALRKHLSLKKGRKARAGIVEVKCLGVCPRGAVTVINGGHARQWTLIPAGTDLDVIVEELDLVSAG